MPQNGRTVQLLYRNPDQRTTPPLGARRTISRMT